MYGLRVNHISEVQRIFYQCDKIDKVLIYGSRAKGNFKKGSYIDMTLLGDGLTLANSIYPVMGMIDDLLLPYLFDISIYSQITNPGLLDHIERVGKVFYDRSQYQEFSPGTQ